MIWQEKTASPSTTLYKALSSDFGSSWGAPQILQTYANTQDNNSQIKMNDLGHTAIIWVDHTSTSNRKVTLGLYDNFGSNLKETKTLPGTSSSRTFPRTDIDPFGNTFFTYALLLGGSSFDVYRGYFYFSNDAFATDVTNAQSFTWSTIRPGIAVAQENSTSYIDAINSWTTKSDGPDITKAFTKRFDVVNVSLSASGSHQELNFFLQRKLKNTVLTNAIDEIGTFYLYKDASLTQLIDSVSAFNQAVNLVEDNIKKDTSNTYYVTWSDGANTIGPVIVIIGN
ncbi:MAG: hypothetical protein K1060chlam5_00656 [Candidatus Anoxychlamydiales bacterium]|nr:hypothetical protein [Candidatus Anoxychlamydiales bacterium]